MDLRAVSGQISELEDDLDQMNPTGRDVDTVQNQLDDMHSFFNKLDEKQDNIGDLEHKAEDLKDNGFVSDSDSLYDEVDGLKKQHTKKNGDFKKGWNQARVMKEAHRLARKYGPSTRKGQVRKTARRAYRR